jgi:hypothetical protein
MAFRIASQSARASRIWFEENPSIRRALGQVRSIEVLVDPDEIPDSCGPCSLPAERGAQEAIGDPFPEGWSRHGRERTLHRPVR